MTDRPKFPKRALITAGMPYGSKELHFGHVGGVFVHADAFARFLRDRIGKENVIFVSVDVTLIEQVIINILQNAVIHGRTTTEIKVCVSEHAKRVLFSIADNGVGIDRDMLPKIFNATSVHIQHGTSDITRDIGIGLSVCKSIITAHGGKMRARNRRNGGAVFEFTLPVEKNI